MDAEKGTAKVAPRQSRAAKLLDAKVDVQIEKVNQLSIFRLLILTQRSSSSWSNR